MPFLHTRQGYKMLRERELFTGIFLSALQKIPEILPSPGCTIKPGKITLYKIRIHKAFNQIIQLR